jgi:hypothetical protein
MIQAARSIEDLIVNLAHEIQVNASVDVTFDALLEQIGPHNETPEGNPLPMKIEPWPGGRWFRDLGNGDGHFWGHVQAIKRPTLLEICGPLMVSYPFVSNLQYRLKEADGGTTISFRHTALGFLLPDDFRSGMDRGDLWILERVRRDAESR